MLLDELCVPLAKPDIDPEVLTFIPTEAPKGLSHSRNTAGRIRVLLSGRKQDTDAPHPLELLRTYRQRPRRRRAAEQRDELAAVHSITSSARASSVGGTSMPSALAIATLMMRSNLVGCSTGMS